MVHLRHANFAELGRDLQERFSEHFRRVWVQYSNNNSRVTVLITLFPRGDGGYRMLFQRNVTDFSIENISSLVEREVRGSLNLQTFGV